MMTKDRRTMVLVLALGTCMAAPLCAQDSGLYDPAANPDAAYLRVIGPPDATVVVGARSMPALEGGVSPYLMIEKAAAVPISAGTVSASPSIGKGSWNSFLVTEGGKGVLVVDPVKNSPAQADLTFYNISDRDDVALYVPAAKAVAIPALAAGAGGWAALKAPLSLDFEARSGSDVLATAPSVALQRRAGTTLVFRGSAGNYELISIAAREIR